MYRDSNSTDSLQSYNNSNSKQMSLDYPVGALKTSKTNRAKLCF